MKYKRDGTNLEGLKGPQKYAIQNQEGEKNQLKHRLDLISNTLSNRKKGEVRCSCGRMNEKKDKREEGGQESDASMTKRGRGGRWWQKREGNVFPHQCMRGTRTKMNDWVERIHLMSRRVHHGNSRFPEG